MQLQFDTTTQVKTGGPLKAPPVSPPLNRNPRKHDIVAWRTLGDLEHWRFETKEAAQEYGRNLPWTIYYKWVLMDGRNMLEKHSIDVPEGWALNDDGLPYKVAL